MVIFIKTTTNIIITIAIILNIICNLNNKEVWEHFNPKTAGGFNLTSPFPLVVLQKMYLLKRE